MCRLFDYPTFVFFSQAGDGKCGIYYGDDYMRTNYDHFIELQNKKYIHDYRYFGGGDIGNIFYVEMYSVRR